MKRHFDATGFLVVICTAFFCAGCAHPIAGIMHPGADRVVLIKSSSSYPNVLLSVDEQNRTLRYMSKDDVKDCYSVNTYDFDARLISTAPFPKFSDSCWQDFGYGAAYGGAVSPDCTSVVYLEGQNRSDTQGRDLSWFDARTGARKVLVKHFAREPNYLEWLCWVSNTVLLVAVDDPDMPEARLLLIDIEKPTVIFEMHCMNLGAHQFALSHSKRYLAYWEGLGRYESRGSFKIFDLRERREVAMTEIGEPAVFGGPKWSPEDDALAYVMDTNMVRFSVASKHSEVLKSFGPHLRIALQGCQGQRLYYRVEPIDMVNPLIRIYCFDLTAQQESHFQNHPEGPFDVFICSDGTMIYYILGQEPL